MATAVKKMPRTNKTKVQLEIDSRGWTLVIQFSGLAVAYDARYENDEVKGVACELEMTRVGKLEPELAQRLAGLDLNSIREQLADIEQRNEWW